VNIRGINKFTLVDYPGKIACIVFIGNCNFICPYCHNPFLVVAPESQPLISELECFSFLRKRKGKLDAVVISGGEPTLQKNLFAFSQKIKEMGYLIKLDTNGSNPDIVKKLHKAGYLDYLGIDYKCPLNRYSEITQSNSVNLGLNVQATISFAVNSKIQYDIRTTVHKAFLSYEDLNIMRNELNKLGVKQWTLQQFNPVDILDDKLLYLTTYTDMELANIAKKLPSTKARGLNS
jgi:pyruvate formate lyase activating enzyme